MMAAAAITDKEAAQKIDNGTWTPFGKGGWSVVGLPTEKGIDFDIDGLVAGFQPMGIALVMTTPTTKPAFEGSGYEMVAAAVQNYDHQGGNMGKDNSDGGGTNPATYTQAELDQKIMDATSALDEKLKTLETEKADATDAAQKLGIDAMAKQKLEYDASLAGILRYKTRRDDAEQGRREDDRCGSNTGTGRHA